MGDPRSDGNTAKHEEANRCHNFTEFGEDLRRLDVGEEKEFIKRVYWYIWKGSETLALSTFKVYDNLGVRKTFRGSVSLAHHPSAQLSSAKTS